MACSTTRIFAVVLLCEAQACASTPRPPAPLVPLETVGVGAVEIYGPGLVGTTDSRTAITFALTASASVVLVRVWPGQRLEQLYPLRTRDTTYFETGWHTVHVPAPADSTLVTGPEAPAALPSTEESEFARCVWQELRRYQLTGSPSSRRSRTRPTPLTIPPNYQDIEDECRRSVSQGGHSTPAGRGEVPLGPYVVLVASDHIQDARHLTMRLGAVDITRSSLTSVLQVLPEFLAGADVRTWAGYVALVSRY